MSNAAFAYDNLAVGSTITVTTEESEHPKARLTDYLCWERCWLNAGTGNIVVNLGSAKDVDIVGLVHTNLTSSNTITLQANSSDSWGSPPYETTISYKERNQIKILASPQTYQYWRIVFTGGSLSNIKIGQLFIGEYYQTTFNIKPGYTRQLSMPRISQTTAHGVKRSYRLGEKRVANNFPFMLLRTDMEEVEAIWEALEGGAYPCILIPDPEDTGDQIAWYVKFPADLQETFDYWRIYDYGNITLVLEEEPPVLEE